MPWPLIPIAAGAAALLAGGTKIAVLAADSRARSIATQVREVEDRARAKNRQYRSVRAQWAHRFAADASGARKVYEEYVSAQGLTDGEIGAIVLPPEIREGMGDLTVSAPPIIDLKKCNSSDTLLQSSIRLSIQSQHLQRSNPKMGNAMQAAAAVGAVAGYIGSNIERIRQVDEYEGKARAYISEVNRIVVSFDSAFTQDLAEDQRTAKRAGDYVAALMQGVSRQAFANHSQAAIYARAFYDYVTYLEALAARYLPNSDET